MTTQTTQTTTTTTTVNGQQQRQRCADDNDTDGCVRDNGSRTCSKQTSINAALLGGARADPVYQR